MIQQLKHALTVTLLFVSITVMAQNKKDYLSLPGPITLNKTTYNLAWSSHPSSNYYKQEYIPANQTVERYTKMVLVEVLLGDAAAGELAKAKINELEALTKTNPMVNYNTFQKNGEYLLDFLISENDATGKPTILERNVYRYKTFNNNGKKGVMLFASSERAYGADVDAFLANLKKTNPVMLNAVAGFVIPQVKIK